MGFWDTTSFGNDDAADWVAGLTAEHASALEAVREPLQVVIDLPRTEYLQAPTAAVAVAAAEVVAAASGAPAPADDDSQAALEWADTHPEIARLRPLAKAAVERVIGSNSELPELWADQLADDGSWSAAMIDLRDRLSGARPRDPRRH